MFIVLHCVETHEEEKQIRVRVDLITDYSNGSGGTAVNLDRHTRTLWVEESMEQIDEMLTQLGQSVLLYDRQTAKFARLGVREFSTPDES